MMKSKYYLVILFLIIISIPTLFLPFYEASTESENRAKDRFPGWSLLVIDPAVFIQKVNAFYNSNFAFRNHFYEVYKFYKYNVLGVSLFPEDVVIGKDGWLFPGNKDRQNYYQSLGVIPDLDLDPVCLQIEEMRLFCDSINADFYFAIAPDKASVYSQYLPIKPVESGKTKRLLIEKLKSEYNIEAIDLGEYLLDNNDNEELVYYKTDSHWNHDGAYWGTKKILDVIRKKHNVDEIDLSNYKKKVVSTSVMDLSRKLDVKILDEYYVWETINKMYTDTVLYVQYDDSFKLPIQKTMKKSASSIDCVVFRDSFFHNMFEFFCNSVDHVVVGLQRFDKKLLRETKPKYVVFELVERRIYHFDMNEYYL